MSTIGRSAGFVDRSFTVPLLFGVTSPPHRAQVVGRGRIARRDDFAGAVTHKVFVRAEGFVGGQIEPTYRRLAETEGWETHAVPYVHDLLAEARPQEWHVISSFVHRARRYWRRTAKNHDWLAAHAAC